MSKLNKKQMKLLSEMSNEQLTEIICELVINNKLAKSQLVSGYLAPPDDILKKAENEYDKKIKAQHFYDYYNVDDFFAELNLNIVLPLEKIVLRIPEKTEVFCRKLLLTFNKLCENADTSGGGWMLYYDGIVNIWLKSLILQKDKGSDVISDKIMIILNEDSYFNFDIFDHYKKDLGYDIIRSLRQRLSSQNYINLAVELSLYIKDVDFIRQCFKDGKLKLSEYVIKYAELLIDELCPAEAILVLNSIKDGKFVEHSEFRDKWTKVFVLALIEERQMQKAREYCLEEFKRGCNIVFYDLYNKASPGSLQESKEIFIKIAKEKGLFFTIHFLSEISDYARIDSEILHAEKSELVDVFNVSYSSFARSLSRELYRHGYGYSAILLRRMLVENNICRSQSKYYNHAVSDMKKGIDYSKNIVWTATVPSTEDFFKYLFSKYKRKHSLWEIMQQKVNGLTVEKESIIYSV